MVEIVTKIALCPLMFQVPIGRADQAKVDLPPVISSHALVGPLLHYAEQFRLQRQRQFAHFVDEQSAPIGQRKRAIARSHGGCEGTSFMSEKLAAREFRRDGRADRGCPYEFTRADTDPAE